VRRVTPDAAAAVMARHARSFAPAARLLAPGDRARVARLYALCRSVDDLADEDGGPAAAARLDAIGRALRTGGEGGERGGGKQRAAVHGRPPARDATGGVDTGPSGMRNAVPPYSIPNGCLRAGGG